MARTADPSGLTAKQRAFVRAYFANGYNATAAAQTAGYKHPDVQGYQVKNHPVVSAEIERLWKDEGLSADETLGRLAQIARGSVARFLRPIAMRVPEEWYDELRETLEAQRNAIANGNLEGAKDLSRDIKRLLAKAEPEPGAFALDLDAIECEGHLVQEITNSEHGPKIKLHSSLKALELFAHHHGQLKERVEVSGPGGGPIDIREVVIERPQVDADDEADASESRSEPVELGW